MDENVSLEIGKWMHNVSLESGKWMQNKLRITETASGRALPKDVGLRTCETNRGYTQVLFQSKALKHEAYHMCERGRDLASIEVSINM